MHRISIAYTCHESGSQHSAHTEQPKWTFFCRLHFGHKGMLCPEIFKRTRDWPRLPSQPPMGTGVPQKNFKCENLKFGLNALETSDSAGLSPTLCALQIYSLKFTYLKFSMWASKTSGLVGIPSLKFSMRCGKLWSTNKKTMGTNIDWP